MGFEEFLETNRRHHGNYRETIYKDDYKYSRDEHDSEYGQKDREKWINILRKVRDDKKLRIFFILAGVLITAIVIVLIIVLMPLIMKLLNYVSQNGVKGITDGITGILDKLLKSLGS
jgi:hypothetical protein